MAGIIGRRIVGFRWMTEAEKRVEAWEWGPPAPVLVLDDGSLIYPSCGVDGNSPGTLFGVSPQGQTVAYQPAGEPEEVTT